MVTSSLCLYYFLIEMPLENFEEEGLAKNPNLELAQWKFMMSTEQHKNDSDIKAKLLDAVKAGGTYFNITFFNVSQVSYSTFDIRYSTGLVCMI